MNLIFAIAAATLAVPATAQQTQPTDTATTVAPETASGSSAAKRPTRYCYLTEGTGSRMHRKDCRTRDEWLKTGVDPLKK